MAPKSTQKCSCVGGGSFQSVSLKEGIEASCHTHTPAKRNFSTSLNCGFAAERVSPNKYNGSCCCNSKIINITSKKEIVGKY